MAQAAKLEAGSEVLFRTGLRGKNTRGKVVKATTREVQVLLGEHWGQNRERTIKPSEVIEMAPAKAKAIHTKNVR